MTAPGCLSAWVRRSAWRREVRRLQRLPRYQRFRSVLLDRPIEAVDAHTFLAQCREIFGLEVYRFASASRSPTILDCGANIGLATLYWKQLYPQSRIVAFEPDPQLFEVLTLNIKAWKATYVELINKAVWTRGGESSFWAEGADAGRLICDGVESALPRISVPTVRLRDYLLGPIDLLKLDVEGAEIDVVADCADCLEGVAHVFVEYHSFAGAEQRLGRLLQVLQAARFRLFIQPQMVIPSPFVTHLNHHGLDQTLNVFAFRPGVGAAGAPP